MENPDLIVTTQNAIRLEDLLQSPIGHASTMTLLLEQELSRARLVNEDQVPPDVVTMNSRVICEDEATGERHEVELVYPHESDAERHRVSVLAPVGAALLGLSVGSAIEWPLPGGRMTRVRVLALPFQPEAASSVGPENRAPAEAPARPT
jgi:regulator of nucleoside diphosphate kinase